MTDLDRAAGLYDGICEPIYRAGWAYTGDASWHPCGNRSSRRYHLPRPADMALAACSRLVVLDDTMGQPDVDVPYELRCRRPACAIRWQEIPQRLELREVLSRWRPGSLDPPWCWEDEAADLWAREPDALRALADDIRANGQQRPVIVGDDGDAWDGHHRIVALIHLEARWVTVTRSQDQGVTHQADL